MKPLSTAERQFVAEYLVDFNATGALIRLGWQPGHANSHAYRWMRRPHVRAAIEKGMRRLDAYVTISAARVLEEVSCVALADPRRLFNDDGTLKAVHELDADTARAVSSIKVTSKPGKDGEPPTYITEVKFWDKNRATEQLLKSLGKLSEGGPVTLNQTTVNAGPGALEQARMCELENKLRAVLGKEPLPAGEIDERVSADVAGLVEPEEEVTIEAAQLPEFDLDPAFA